MIPDKRTMSKQFTDLEQASVDAGGAWAMVRNMKPWKDAPLFDQMDKAMGVLFQQVIVSLKQEKRDG